jgi:hypothetical protein
MLKIDPNFWKDVEDPTKLKYVIYGDSVTPDNFINVKIADVVQNCTVGELWDQLTKLIGYSRVDGKEQIIIDSKFQIETYDRIYKKYYTNPTVMIRHRISGQVCKLTTLDNHVTTTLDHSLINFGKQGTLIKVSPKEATKLLDVTERTAIEVDIINKEYIKYDGYVYDFSVPQTQNFIVNDILVHNTDSLYVHVPNQKYETNQQASDITDNLAKEINGIITNLLNNHLLVKMNVDRQYNKTVFKTESVISKMMLLNAKKNYAYEEIAKKGHVHSTPETKYVGIPIVRSDYSKFAQDLIKYLIEEVALKIDAFDGNVSDVIFDLLKAKHSTLEEELTKFNFKYIATPGRWKLGSTYKSEPFTIIGMRLYNTMVDAEIFRPGLNGLSFPIEILDVEKFKQQLSRNFNRHPTFINNTPLIKINYLTVPTNYEVETLEYIFEKYSIKPNVEELWSKNFGTVAKNVITVIREYLNKN